MTRHHKRAFFLVFLVGNFFHATLPIDAKTPPGIAVVGEQVVDFGRHPANKRQTATFKLINRGEDPLVIHDVRKTCGCSAVEIDKRKLSSEENATVTVSILPESITGSYSKNVYVRSDDPKRPLLTLTVKGTAAPLIEVSPKPHIFLKTSPARESSSHIFHLRPNGEEEIQLGRPGIKTKGVEAQARILPQKREDGARSLEVRVNPKPEVKRFECQITVPIIHPPKWNPVKLSLLGKVGPVLRAVPATIRISLDGPFPQTRRFKLRLLTTGSPKLSPSTLGIPALPGVDFRVRPIDAGVVEVTAKFAETIVASLSAGEILNLRFEVPEAAPAILKISTPATAP